MKKLTKRVKAGELWFDVPVNVNYVAFSHTGDVYGYLREPPKSIVDWKQSVFQPFGMVSLEGADWRECCWYVGDQVDGEAVERREWMARGVEKSIELISGSSWDESDGDGIVAATDAMEIIAAKIRAGEIDQ